MPIYLHPIDESPSQLDENRWVEIDLVSWKTGDKNYPYGITLLRRLNTDSKKPYLQELMFEDLYRGAPVKQLTLEVPLGQKTIQTHRFNGIKVIDYSLKPPHPDTKKPHEKITIMAKYKEVLVL